MASKKIEAFGQMIDRSKAYEIIINDKICDICFANNSDTLEDLLMYGWEGLSKWTDGELEDFISELCIYNQPNGKI